MRLVVGLFGALLGLGVFAPPALAADEVAWAPVILPAARQTDIRASDSDRVYRLFVSIPTDPTPP